MIGLNGNMRGLIGLRAAPVTCARAVVLALLAGSVLAHGSDAGIRGRLYENPAIGIAVVWEPSIWTAAEASGDERGPANREQLALENESATAIIETWREASKGDELSLDACVAERLAAIEGDPSLSDVRLVGAPELLGGYPFGSGVSGRWSASIRLDAGRTAPAAIGITCMRGPGTDLLSTIRETRIHIDGTDGPGWPAMFEGYQYREVLGGAGPVFDIQGTMAPGSRPPGQVIVRVRVENLDETPGTFDVAGLMASEQGALTAPLGFAVIEAPDADSGPRFVLAPGERLTIDVVFAASDPMAVGVSLETGGRRAEIMQPCCGGSMAPLVRLTD